MSSIICDRGWHLKIVAFECHRGWASGKIKDVACIWKPCTARLNWLRWFQSRAGLWGYTGPCLGHGPDSMSGKTACYCLRKKYHTDFHQISANAIHIPAPDSHLLATYRHIFWLTSNMTSITKVQSASTRLFASTWRPLLSVIITLYYVAIIFRRPVWYRVLSLCNACIRSWGIILIP